MSQSIKSQSVMRTLVNDEFRSNHEQVFGDKPAERGRFIWDRERQEMVPEREFVAPEEPSNGRTMVVSDLYMDGDHAQDGTDIGSRKKRREYMERNGLADASDYANAWQQKKAERAAAMRGEVDPRRTREAVADAMKRLQAGYRPRPTPREDIDD